MRATVRALVNGLPEEFRASERAVCQHEAAVRHRDAVVARARHHLDVALGGMTLRQWRSRVAGTVAIRTSADGRDLHHALKRRPAIEEALASLDAVRAAELAKVADARRTLAEAAARLLGYGPMAEQLTCRSLAELHRIARVVAMTGPEDDQRS